MVYAVERPCCRDLLSLSPRSLHLSPSLKGGAPGCPEEEGGGKSGKGKRENTLVVVVVVPGGGIKGPNNVALVVVPGGWLGEWHERWLRGPGCQPSLYHV